MLKGSRMNRSVHRICTSPGLQAAVYFGMSETMKKLISTIEDIDEQDSIGFTALHRAAQTGRESALVAILEAGAFVDARTGFSDPRKPPQYKPRRCTALHIAAAAGFKHLVRALIEHHADVNALNWKRQTPLMLAAFKGNVDVLQLLLENGAKADSEDESRRGTVLVQILRRYHTQAEGDSLPRIVQLLLQNGADIDARCECHRRTALHWVASRGMDRILEVLLPYGPELDAKDRDGHTPLHHASIKGHLSMRRSLLVHGSNVNAG